MSCRGNGENQKTGQQDSGEKSHQIGFVHHFKTPFLRTVGNRMIGTLELEWNYIRIRHKNLLPDRRDVKKYKGC